MTKYIREQISLAKNDNKKIVLTTGVFDIIHQEHKNFLIKAKAAGDYLIVCVERDSRVKQIKGVGRPINHQLQRVKNIQALNIANLVFLLPAKFNDPQDHHKFIAEVKPDIYAVSSHSSHITKKSKIMKNFGGELKIVHSHNPNISSTKIIQGKVSI